MNLTILSVLIILVLLTLLLFLLLKKEIGDINKKSRLYFNRKIQEYTDEVLNKDSESNISDNVTVEEKGIEDKKEDLPKETIVYVEKKANYEISDLLKMMKQVDSNFNLNNEKVINRFIGDYVNDDTDISYRYKSLCEMKKYIDDIGIYNIITTFDDDLSDKIINNLKLINEDIFVEYYSVKNIFDIEDFCNFLDYEMGKCDPTIYVYVGNNHYNYDYINKRIKTLYSDEIYKGIKIIYLNKLYDYSLSE